MKVNYEGAVNVVEACKRLGIKRTVMSSSPSSRFPWSRRCSYVLLVFAIYGETVIII
jgi:nucleoside-diphosphate-sugar epimerase